MRLLRTASAMIPYLVPIVAAATVVVITLTGFEVSDNGNSNEIDILIDTDYLGEIMYEDSISLSLNRKLLASEIFSEITGIDFACPVHIDMECSSQRIMLWLLYDRAVT
ncbi:hypothetical protein TNIN_83311 [Trichonephila inaurata madagascariensis]|uniref:Uncharacterized protein n=1 Tax=Trichonephila inaurata madagascariensis TaxID=2747483 RepID=A0A8X7CRP4_9ARAC|nr:hypothetical protein TNIN_83311 [Trichonephila inaurata madagascariensis]